jgi:hypothetical protein
MEQSEQTVVVLSREETVIKCEPGTLAGIDATSGVLQKISYKHTLDVLRHWNECLAPDGILKLAVTDFDKVAKDYLAGTGDAEARLCGDDALNKAIFNREKILTLVSMAGFEIVGGADGSLSWQPEPGVIAVTARKRVRKNPEIPLPGIHAIMSLPRVSWTETMTHLYESLSNLQIPFTKATGVFWSQSLQRMMQQLVDKDDLKYILTMDYDSIFDAKDILRLWQIMEDNPDIGALCPLQIGRDRDQVLMNLVDAEGKPINRFEPSLLYNEALDISMGHFGLTLIRVDALKRLPKPWFWGQPNKDGDWTEGRVDDDVYFWRKMRENGQRVCVTPKVRLGHLQLMITWPSDDLRTIHQYVGKYYEDGRPPECMTY